MDSPTSILDNSVIDNDMIENVPNISREDIFNGAKIGFEIVKNKLNKQSITPGDCLNEFFKFDPNHDDYISLFLLSIIMVSTIKSKIDNDSYTKLFNYIVSHFNSNS